MNKEDAQTIKSIVQTTFDGFRVGLREEIQQMVLDEHRHTVDIVQQEIRGIRKEISGIHGEISGLHTEVTGLKGDIALLRAEATETEGRIMNAISDIHDTLIKPRFADHERRITKLEMKMV